MLAQSREIETPHGKRGYAILHIVVSSHETPRAVVGDTCFLLAEPSTWPLHHANASLLPAGYGHLSVRASPALKPASHARESRVITMPPVLLVERAGVACSKRSV